MISNWQQRTPNQCPNKISDIQKSTWAFELLGSELPSEGLNVGYNRDIVIPCTEALNEISTHQRTNNARVYSKGTEEGPGSVAEL
jgi:hypothetical protein